MNSTVDDKVRALVEKIESSKKLPDTVKNKLYVTIEAGLQSMVWPILIGYLPQDQLEVYKNNPKALTVEAYIELLNKALEIKDGEALVKIDQAMQHLLDDLDAALTQEV